MIEMTFKALSLDLLFKAPSKELKVIALYNRERSGEYRRDFL